MQDWERILYGCFGSWTRAYGFDAASSGHETICERIMDAHLPSNSWAVGEAGGNVFLVRSGYVGDYLGWDHRGAKDGVGRKLEFHMCYWARAGAPLPSVSDLEGLRGQITKDLVELGEASWKARGPIRGIASVKLPGFSSPLESATEWDKTVAALRLRKHPASMIVSTGDDGSFQHHMTSAEHAPRLSPETEAHRVGDDSWVKKTSEIDWSPGKKHLLMVAATIAIGAAIVGWWCSRETNKLKSTDTPAEGR